MSPVEKTALRRKELEDLTKEENKVETTKK